MNRAQVESFGEEIQCLLIGEEIHKKSRIKSLDPRLEDGFLVVGGRLQRAQCLPYRTRHPNQNEMIYSLTMIFKAWRRMAGHH